MRVLLSTPPFHPHQSYSLKFPRFPALNLALLATLVRARHDVRIANLALRPRDGRFLLRLAWEWRPDVIGFAVPSPVSALRLGEAVTSLRRAFSGVRIVAGGPFPTFEPDFCLGLGFDAVFLGEADATFPAWLDDPHGPRPGVLRAGEREDPAPEPQVTEDLDALPFPAWDLLEYRPAIYTGRKAAAVEMSRGCPFGCTFCTVHGFGKRYRVRSVPRVLAELGELARAGVGELLFVDNSFALEGDRATALAEGILSAGWTFEFGAYLRADTIAERPETIRLLARAGLRYAIVGFESYSDRSLSAMRKASAGETNLAAARILRGAGIRSIGSHIYGTPGESLHDLWTTYRLGVRHSDLYKAGVFTPLPGSALHARLRAEGLLARADPLAPDHVHYLVGDRRTRRRIQILSVGLFLRYFAGPARLAKLLSRDPWMRRIFAAEYRAITRRIAWLVAWRLGARKSRELGFSTRPRTV